MLCPDEASTCTLQKSAPLAPVRGQRLETVEAKCVLCGGVSKDHVRVIEHVQAIQRQWVDFQIIQWEVGVYIKADICGQRASQVLRQAWGRLSTH